MNMVTTPKIEYVGDYTVRLDRFASIYGYNYFQVRVFKINVLVFDKTFTRPIMANQIYNDIIEKLKTKGDDGNE